MSWLRPVTPDDRDDRRLVNLDDLEEIAAAPFDPDVADGDLWAVTGRYAGATDRHVVLAVADELTAHTFLDALSMRMRGRVSPMDVISARAVLVEARALRRRIELDSLFDHTREAG